MAEHLDGRSTELRLIEKSIATRLIYGYYPQNTMGISDRDALCRCVSKIFKDDGGLLEAGRSVIDERTPPVKNVVRSEVLNEGFLVMEKEGSGGKVSVACRLSRVNPMFTVSLVKKLASKLKSIRLLNRY